MFSHIITSNILFAIVVVCTTIAFAIVLKKIIELDTTITDIEFSQDESLSYNFVNYLKKGTLSIYKVDGQKGLQGAHFLLRGTNYSFDTYLESNSFGFTIVEGIPYDLYSLQEIKAPIGYIMDNEIKTFFLNQDFLQYNFENQTVK